MCSNAPSSNPSEAPFVPPWKNGALSADLAEDRRVFTNTPLPAQQHTSVLHTTRPCLKPSLDCQVDVVTATRHRQHTGLCCCTPPPPLFFFTPVVSIVCYSPPLFLDSLFTSFKAQPKGSKAETSGKVVGGRGVGGSCSCKMLLRSIAQFLTCSAPSSPGSEAVEADDRPGSSILSSLNPRLSWPVVQNLSQKFVRRCNPRENRQQVPMVCAHCSQKRLVCTKNKHPERLFPLSTFFPLGQI